MKTKIKGILSQKGMTQKELAEKIGMSETGLSLAINGNTTKATTLRIADALGVSIDNLTDKPIAVKFSGEINLGNILIPCYILEDGRRVLSGRGIQEALNMVDDNKSTSGHRLLRYLNQKTLNPFIFKDKEPGHFYPIECTNGEQRISGYEASVMIDICDGFLEARNHISLSPRQAIIAERCEILVRSFAKVGLIALIDEATGYNKEKTRAKNELQKFLSAFLNEEASKWVKTFPDSFFEDIYKMKGWSWRGTSKRPGVVGIIINDLVYDRLAPELRKELNVRNPKNENGNRNHKHHQFLTEIGKPKLNSHLEALHALAVASNFDWTKFMSMVELVYKKNASIPTLFDDYDWND